MAKKKIVKHHQRTTIAQAMADAQGREVVLSGDRKLGVKFEDGQVWCITSWYDVRAFGAVADGITNDTTAIQAAIDAASAVVGGNVFIPRGSYCCHTAIRLKSFVNIICEKKSHLVAGTNGMTVVDTVGSSVTEHVAVVNLGVTNDLNKTGVIGVDANQCRHDFIFDSCYFYGIDIGLKTHNLCWQTSVRECYALVCRIGFEVTNSSHNLRYDRCTALQCTEDGFYAHAEVTDVEPILFKIQYNNCLAQANTRYGYNLKTCGSPSIIGGYVEANYEADIFADGCQFIHTDAVYGGSNFGNVHIRLRNCDGGNLNNVMCAGVRWSGYNGSATSGNPTITGMASTAPFTEGVTYNLHRFVAGVRTAVSGTYTVLSKTSTTITFTTNLTVTDTVYPEATSWTFDVDSSNDHCRGFVLRGASNNLITGVTTGLKLMENTNGSGRAGEIGASGNNIKGFIETSFSGARHYHLIANNRNEKNDVTSSFVIDCRTAYDIWRKGVRGGEYFTFTNPEDGQFIYLILRGAADMGDRPADINVAGYNINMMGAGASQNTIIGLEYDADYGWIIKSDSGWNQSSSQDLSVQGLRLRIASTQPTTGSWKKGDYAFNTANTFANGIQGWKCSDSGTFSSYSQSAGCVNGSNLLVGIDTTGLSVGDFVSMSTGFAADTRSQVKGFRTNGAASEGAGVSTNLSPTITWSGTFNISDFNVGDFVTLSAGFASTVIPYKILSKTTTSITVSVNATSSQTGITVQAVAGVELADNAISTVAFPGVAVSTPDPVFDRDVRFGSEGSNTASANDITISYGSFFTVTGSVEMRGLIQLGFPSGTIISMKFTGTPLIKHNGAASGGFGKYLLNGSIDFTPTAGSILTLLFDGTNWNEVTRMVR